MVTPDFAFVEVVLFRNDAQIRASVASNVILHAAYGRIANGVVDRCERAGFGCAASEHVKTH